MTKRLAPLVQIRLLVVLAALFSTSTCRDAEQAANDDGGNGGGPSKSLVGKWDGVFESKEIDAKNKTHQASIIFNDDKTFTLELKEDERPKAFGTWEDGGDNLLLFIKESSILPEFAPQAYIRLKYKMRGKILTLSGDEETAFTLTRQDGGNASSSPQNNTTTGLFGWWQGGDSSGGYWTLQIEESKTFWLSVSVGGESPLIMKGEWLKRNDQDIILTVTEAGDSGLHGRRFRFQLAEAQKAFFSILKRTPADTTEASSAFAMNRK